MRVATIRCRDVLCSAARFLRNAFGTWAGGRFGLTNAGGPPRWFNCASSSCSSPGRPPTARLRQQCLQLNVLRPQRLEGLRFILGHGLIMPEPVKGNGSALPSPPSSCLSTSTVGNPVRQPRIYPQAPILRIGQAAADTGDEALYRGRTRARSTSHSVGPHNYPLFSPPGSSQTHPRAVPSRRGAQDADTTTPRAAHRRAPTPALLAPFPHGYPHIPSLYDYNLLFPKRDLNLKSCKRLDNPSVFCYIIVAIVKGAEISIQTTVLTLTNFEG